MSRKPSEKIRRPGSAPSTCGAPPPPEAKARHDGRIIVPEVLPALIAVYRPARLRYSTPEARHRATHTGLGGGLKPTSQARIPAYYCCLESASGVSMSWENLSVGFNANTQGYLVHNGKNYASVEGCSDTPEKTANWARDAAVLNTDAALFGAVNTDLLWKA